MFRSAAHFHPTKAVRCSVCTALNGGGSSQQGAPVSLTFLALYLHERPFVAFPWLGRGSRILQGIPRHPGAMAAGQKSVPFFRSRPWGCSLGEVCTAFPGSSSLPKEKGGKEKVLGWLSEREDFLCLFFERNGRREVWRRCRQVQAFFPCRDPRS